MRKSRFGELFLLATAILGVCRGAEATERSLIFPTPREIVQSGSDFVLNEQAVIAIPAFPSEEDLFLAQSLADDLGDRFAVHLKTERVAKLDPDRRLIVMGSTANPWCGRIAEVIACP